MLATRSSFWKSALFLAFEMALLNQAVAQQETKSDTPRKASSVRPFLGILVEELSPALASHLPAIASAEHGLVIHDVTPDSPAAKAGLRPHDVLLTYDDQKLFVPEQLTRLVRNDQPRRIVKLEVIRAGKAESVSVTLGEWPESPQKISPTDFTARRPGFGWGAARERRYRGAMAWPLWKSFDEVTVRKLDGHRFHLTLGHTDSQKQSHRYEFEGTCDEIHHQIETDKDLSDLERAHLLRTWDQVHSGFRLWISPEGELFDE